MNDTKEIIMMILDEIGISRTVKGYWYWIDLIQMNLESKITNIQIFKIYKSYAELKNTTLTAVERALRHPLINKEEKIKEYFGIDYDNCHTNKSFLILMIEEVKEKLIKKHTDKI